MGKTKKNTFSIIIPFKKPDKRLYKCLMHCLRLNYDSKKYDIILLPDINLSKSEIWNCLKGGIDKKKFSSLVKIIPTGSIAPGKKRNIGMKKSKAQYFACIDADAFPHKDWLVNSLPFLRYPDVGIVGGPNKAPPGIGYLEKMAIESLYLHVTVGGLYHNKRFGKNAIEYSDMSSSNLIIKREVAKECGYYDENYYPGEDSVLCFNVTKRQYKIIFAEDVIVYHHRRPLFRPHLKKFAETAEIRPKILKRFKGQKIFYFFPSFFLGLIFILLILSVININFFWLLLIILVGYFSIVILDCLVCRIYNPVNILVACMAVFLTHLCYGYGFIKGLLFRT